MTQKLNYSFFGLVIGIYNNKGEYEVTNNNSNGAMDITPGGYTGTTKAIWNQLTQGLMDNFFVFGFDSDIVNPNYSFIPSVSSLGFNNTNFQWATRFDDRNLVCSGEIPFDYYYAPNENEEHISFTKDSYQWLLEEVLYAKQGCPNICSDSIMRQDGVSPLTFLCPNIEYTFTLDEWIPTNATAVWSASPGITFVGGNTGNTVVIKYTGTVPATENGYLEVVITPRLGSTQCAAKKTIRQKISYGNEFNIVLSTDSGAATQFTGTVMPNYPGNTYS